MSGAWSMRAVQLDLARQTETLVYIRGFIDFISKFGYNTLVLYLEGKIRTKSFGYMPVEESYSPDDMRVIVAYAAEKGIDVVPVVSTLGHCEQFLKYRELEHLAELRDGTKGRFSEFKHVVCPSLGETYKFFESYLSEVAELFPSEYFHAGCDEVFDLGYCPLCRERVGREGQSAIFAKHIMDIHSIISGKLGKKMIIWDDMFEFYPEALEAIPRDIILCSWQYDGLMDIPKSHFSNRLREDTLLNYRKLGFEYIIAPGAAIRNIETFTAYSSIHKPLGGLVTIWEMSTAAMCMTYPAVAFAGKLWADGKNEGSELILRESLKDLFGFEDGVFQDAVISLKNLGGVGERNSPTQFLRGSLNDMEYERLLTLNLLDGILRNYKNEKMTTVGREIIEDMILYIDRAKLQLEIHSFMIKLFNPKIKISTRKNLLNEIGRFLDRNRDIRDRRKAQWDKFRPGLKSDVIDLHHSAFEENFKALKSETENPSILTVRFFLPDMYSAQKTAIHVKYEADGVYEKIGEGVFKPSQDNSTYYEYSFQIHLKSNPVSVKLETWGYGGQGFTYLNIETKDNTFVPKTILKSEGKILNPEYVLIDDLKWCFAGEEDTRLAYMNPEMAETRHVLEVSLSKK